MGILARRWIGKCSFIDTLGNDKALLASFYDGNKTWLVFRIRYEGGTVLGFWEEMIYEHSPGGVSFDFLCTVIEYIVTLCQGKGVVEINKSIRYSPRGWRYSSGIPSSVSEYFIYEFDKDLEDFIVENNIQGQNLK